MKPSAKAMERIYNAAYYATKCNTEHVMRSGSFLSPATTDATYMDLHVLVHLAMPMSSTQAEADATHIHYHPSRSSHHKRRA